MDETNDGHKTLKGEDRPVRFHAEHDPSDRFVAGQRFRGVLAQRVDVAEVAMQRATGLDAARPRGGPHQLHGSRTLIRRKARGELHRELGRERDTASP